MSGGSGTIENFADAAPHKPTEANWILLAHLHFRFDKRP
jgi:hypothetical protein